MDRWTDKTNQTINEYEQRLEVMRAYAAGKAVQYWDPQLKMWKTPVGGPEWSWECDKYRIAPEPRKAREFMLALHPSGVVAFQVQADEWTPLQTIRVREVLPEDK